MCLHYAGEICKRCFHYENVLRPYYTGEIWQPNNHQSFWIYVWGKLGKEIPWCHRFRTSQLSKCFPSTLKRKTGVFKFLQFEERFGKAAFSWRISVDYRPHRRNKAVLSNVSGIVWVGHTNCHKAHESWQMLPPYTDDNRRKIARQRKSAFTVTSVVHASLNPAPFSGYVIGQLKH